MKPEDQDDNLPWDRRFWYGLKSYVVPDHLATTFEDRIGIAVSSRYLRNTRPNSYGAARTKFNRFMDRQTYWNWEWRQNEDDWKSAAPFLKPIYPASLFKGRKVFIRTHTCDWCDEKFTPKRSGAKFCSAECKQAAYRRRKSVTDNGTESS